METKLEEKEVLEIQEDVEVHDALQSEQELKTWIQAILELMLSGMSLESRL